MATKRENDAHLEKNPEGVPDVVGIELLEALGAVTALEEEGPANGGLGEPLLQAAGLASEHDRRERLQRLNHRLQLRRVRVLGQLEGLLLLPAVDPPWGRDRRSRRFR